MSGLSACLTDREVEILRLLAAEPGLQRRYLGLLSGDLDYADLGWHALPRLGLRLLRRTRRRAA